ncbi:Integrator complex subunit 9 [Homalodisca vitripennis]|nr:Integrator complex subunit 9 [Homalodisca vitripennis]
MSQLDRSRYRQTETLQNLQVFQHDLQMTDVEEWLVKGNVLEVTVNEDLSNDQIIAIVLNEAEEEEIDSDDEETTSDNVMNHSAAKDVFEVVLKYIEQHPNSTSMDVLWEKIEGYFCKSLKPEDDVASTSSGLTKLRNPGEPMRNLQYEYGPLGIDQFVQRLNQEGISDAKIEPHKNGYIIHLQEHDTLIQIDDNLTHIYCGVADQELRLRLRSILLQCLNKF